MGFSNANDIRKNHGDLKIGTKVIYERNIIDLHLGEGERAIMTYEVTGMDMSNHTYSVKETTAIMGGPTSTKNLKFDMHTIISIAKAKKIVDACDKSLLESIAMKEGRVLSCRSSNSKTSLIFYAAVPFGYSYKVDYDENKHVAVKFMLKEYKIP